jgi:hypothetical protein
MRAAQAEVYHSGGKCVQMSIGQDGLIDYSPNLDQDFVLLVVRQDPVAQNSWFHNP